MRQKILVIDDSAPVHELVKFRLKHDGVDVICATDPALGVGLSSTAAPDLILLDVDMPGLDGFEVCRRLKANPQTSNIPVMFLTGKANVQHKVRGLALGAVDYVTKPFDGTELRARVKASLRSKQAQDLIARRVMVDDLTQLWNRNYFEYRIVVSSAEAVRFHRPLSCVLIDVDHLHSINAIFGHAAGDEVLRAVSHRLRKTSRTEDTISRLDGGTFAVLSPNTAGSQCVRFAQRLWHNIISHPVHHRRQTVNFKCSFGVTHWNRIDGPGILDRAAQALARAKLFGGGRVAFFDESTSQAQVRFNMAA